MQLPAPLQRAIDEELAACDPAQLRPAVARLSASYRQSAAGGPVSVALTDDNLRAAYLAVRMPATFAAVVAALDWTREAYGQESGEPIRTMLDLGSGPGTAVWAATQVFPTLDSVTAIERDPHMIQIARRLAPAAGAASSAAYPAVLRNTHWMQGDLAAALPEGIWDLVVCSYALNELGETHRAELIRQAWKRTGKLLVVVEPGTLAGFANVLAVRTRLLAKSHATSSTNPGATTCATTCATGSAALVAPCPNSRACPMAGGGDWCHFAARVERTAGHRRLKGATLGHEDEKFSYVAFSPAPASGGPYPSPSSARIVRHPRIFSGYTQLTLCREGEIAATTVTRSRKEDWRRLKRLGWGDRW
jgi:ribosomal protein RSM22 (predicted rRNA methylase)